MLYFIVLFFIFAYLLYWYTTRNFNFWKDQGVPYLKPLPFFGNFPIFSQQNLIDFMRELYFKFPDRDYFGIWFLQHPKLIIRSPELIKNILVKDFDHFFDRVSSSGDHDPWGKYNLFSSNQPIWSELRKRLSPVFTTAKLKTFQKVMHEKSINFIDNIDNYAEDGLMEIAGRYAIDVVTATSFGFNADTLSDRESPLKRITKLMTDSSNIKRRLELIIGLYLPQLSPLFKTYLFSKEGSEYFTQIYRKVEADRKMRKNTNKVESLLDVLSKCEGESVGDGLVLTDEIIAAQGVLFMFASVESSAVNIALALLEIAHRSDVQKRLFNEIDCAIKTNGSLNYEAVYNLRYLDMCIKETLRKYPTIATLDRKCMKDYKVDDSFTIRKGTAILINNAGLQHDPKYFPNPKVWDPERFSPENEITPFTYLPFGDGPRNCIGSRNGILSLKTLIATILSQFELKPDIGTPHPDNLKLSPNDAFTHPSVPIHVKFVGRNSFV